jgi:hypothetical protein
MVIFQQLPESKLVFVVNGKAVGTFDHKEPKQVIQIYGKVGSKEIQEIFDALKKTP